MAQHTVTGPHRDLDRPLPMILLQVLFAIQLHAELKYYTAVWNLTHSTLLKSRLDLPSCSPCPGLLCQTTASTKLLTNHSVSFFHTHFPHCCCKQSHFLPQLFESHLHNFLLAFPWGEKKADCIETILKREVPNHRHGGNLAPVSVQVRTSAQKASKGQIYSTFLRLCESQLVKCPHRICHLKIFLLQGMLF